MTTIARPEVPAECYRKLEVLTMQIALQLPHHDVGKCLIIHDLLENIIKRWTLDERMAQHQPEKAIEEGISQGAVVRLVKD